MGKARSKPQGKKRPPRTPVGPTAQGPSVVLVKPQLGENIGFAARAMANFGLSDLRLVAPRDGWPNARATAAAANAEFVIERARIYASVEEAIGDLHYVIATTARLRGMVKPVLSPEGAAKALRRRQAAGERSGILFGPERSGLDNDTIALADALLTAPVSPDCASLSLPQAVLVVAYEWMKRQRTKATLGRGASVSGQVVEGLHTSHTRPATRKELFGLFAHLEAELDRAGFLRPPEKRPAMVRAIRNMFHRMGATEQDVRTWRGIVAALSRHRSDR